ncbi:MAG: M20/M25/M40 family metallo-hydrolase [Gracilimonas sp.]
MMGRHAFSDEIELAADFIAGEFKTTGISTLPGLEDYRQNFTIYSLKSVETSVIINNEPIEDDYYFGLINEEELKWKTDDIQIYSITEKDDYRNKFKQYSSDDKSSVILVDKTHKKWFHRYRSYFTRSNRTFEVGAKPNDIFVLYNEEVNSLNIHIKNEIQEIKLFNVVGVIEGNRKDEIVLFSAHYDHIGVISPVNQDSIANGANDNASGVAGIIELARYFERLPKPERTIYFVAFTAEEAGGYGSGYFSKQVNPDKIVAMFNIEMIGKPALEGPNSAWITGFEYSTFGEILQNSVVDSVFTFYPDPFPNQNLFFRSDNATLAKLGVPAHSISTTPIDIDQDYHRVTDEYKTLHIPHTKNTIQAIAKAAEVIISGEKTPTRISPDILD